jgi:hypothetical protein
MTTATIPDLSGFATHYGVRISCIGEDGDMVILGHVDRRRTIAAVRAYLRYLWGNQLEVDDYLSSRLLLDPWEYTRAAERAVTATAGARSHAVQLPPPCDQPRTCTCDRNPSCVEMSGVSWWLDCDADPDNPDAFPVTYWSVD